VSLAARGVIYVEIGQGGIGDMKIGLNKNLVKVN
jgi:hypothetical protein